MADKIKLLYVDDEAANLNVFRIAFKRKYDVTTVESANEGLKLMEEGKYDVIISDHRMPEMTGVELLEKVGNMYPDMIRIIISEYVNDEIIRNAIKNFGFDGSVGKPWDADQLIALIEKK
ncbi:response regulator [Reichenbachiella carrageenanivorans]|uniref:Response regulator n=1 Tax=Reichenbachiella carrageenanivorans TaxID=2979869 RepID=A0ABY6D3P1_9BACT|nr:response regulator [Reichenbachiella carrageenanivorans]UXX79678.1 response regulator [Reichenbachiella carrageenanivorans]